MTKLVLIGGAGNIGSSLAFLAAIKTMVHEVIIFDLNGSICAGKALDLTQCCNLLNTDVKLSGSGDYAVLEDADIIVVTAGFPRQPGMSRDDLLHKNASVISDIGKKIRENAKRDPLIIVVTNPLDVMTWMMLKVTGLSKRKVIGMSGALDTSRLNCFLAEALGVSAQCVNSVVFGGHGDTMVLSTDYISVSGIPLSALISVGAITEEQVTAISDRARNGGAEIVRLLGHGSAYYAPATCIAYMIDGYINDRNILLPCCVLLEGEYNVNNACIGVPVIIGREGVKKIVELPLNSRDESAFRKSVNAVEQLIAKLN